MKEYVGIAADEPKRMSPPSRGRGLKVDAGGEVMGEHKRRPPRGGVD